jgi:glycosyltransferase involved in cell wall biosynthesis
MHLAFIDIFEGYAADRPDQDAPFGGTNTAVCFMARALKQAGVECTIFNRVKDPLAAHGISSLPIESLIDERANPKYSAFIFCGRWTQWLVEMVRETTSAPLVIWMHESTFEPKLTPALPIFDGIIFVSEWQSRVNQKFLPKHWRQTIIRNAMNPVFADMFGKISSVLDTKVRPPVLIYAGATPRGVLYMPLLLKHLRELRGDFSVEIYSSCAPTHDAAINAQCLENMKQVPSVTHVGLVGQAELARRMKRASIFVSPNPWPETSCITLIEALASGMRAVTTNRAVLPETAAGFAKHIPIEGVDDLRRFDMPMPTEEFAKAIAENLAEIESRSSEMEGQLRKQTDYFNAHYKWDQRVKPWTDYIEGFAKKT